MKKISFPEYTIYYFNIEGNNGVKHFENLEYLSSLCLQICKMNDLDEITNFAYEKRSRTIPKARLSFMNKKGEETVFIELEESKGTKDFIGLVKRLLNDKGYELENGENELEL